MDFITLIFLLVRKFVPINQTEFDSMKLEADEWHAKVVDTRKAPDNPAQKFYVEHSRKWYVKLALAVSYIPLQIWIGRQMQELNNPNPLPQNLKDESAW